MNIAHRRPGTPKIPVVRLISTFLLTAVMIAGLTCYEGTDSSNSYRVTPVVHAGGSYASLAAGNLSFSITPATANVITSNNNWTGFPSVEGYFGLNLTPTHGVDPQTILGTEFAGNTLPNSPPQVNANKSNPSAYNAGGLAEFDSGPYLALGFQGNTQANPYLVFFVNTLGRSNVTITYQVTDIDGGSNNAVSQLALQYRTGPSGLFTNIPAGFIADATDGPNLSGRVTTKTVLLPTDAWNKPQIQIRLITTNAANTSGGSTPDEWIGVNNVIVSGVAPTAGPVEISGRVLSDAGRSIGGANVYATDETGSTRRVSTNSFGYYRFTGLVAGQTYILVATSRQYTFAPMVLTPTDDLAGVNFVSIPARSPAPAAQLMEPAMASPLRRKTIH